LINVSLDCKLLHTYLSVHTSTCSTVYKWTLHMQNKNSKQKFVIHQWLFKWKVT